MWKLIAYEVRRMGKSYSNHILPFFWYTFNLNEFSLLIDLHVLVPRTNGKPCGLSRKQRQWKSSAFGLMGNCTTNCFFTYFIYVAINSEIINEAWLLKEATSEVGSPLSMCSSRWVRGTQIRVESVWAAEGFLPSMKWGMQLGCWCLSQTLLFLVLEVQRV